LNISLKEALEAANVKDNIVKHKESGSYPSHLSQRLLAGLMRVF